MENSSIPGMKKIFPRLRNFVILKYMKPQDVIVLIKLHIWNKGRWKIVPLAESVFISKTEVHKAIQRLKKSALYDSVLERPKKSAMEEFFVYGLKYCFPAELGAETRGVPTAYSAPFLENKIVTSNSSAIVWPHATGSKRGTSLQPLYKTAAQAALHDPLMHHYLALIDVLRIGQAREQAIAKDGLIRLIQQRNTNEI